MTSGHQLSPTVSTGNDIHSLASRFPGSCPLLLDNHHDALGFSWDPDRGEMHAAPTLQSTLSPGL